ncbi:MAG: hypothetical protein NZT92_13270 [Abditibacteriales bacterium]|nr:hypothetical protein [Abditibacteriales bacterium]
MSGRGGRPCQPKRFETTRSGYRATGRAGDSVCISEVGAGISASPSVLKQRGLATERLVAQAIWYVVGRGGD